MRQHTLLLLTLLLLGHGSVHGAGAAFRNGLDRSGAFDVSAASATPTVLWKAEIGMPKHDSITIQSSPVFHKDRIYVGGSDGFYAIAAGDGSVLWKVDIKGGSVSSACVKDDLLAICGLDGRLYGIDITDGSTKWTAKAPNKKGESSLSAAIAYDRVFISGLGFDLSTGKKTWKSLIRGGPGVNAAPAMIPEALVYGPNAAENVYAIDLRTGKQFWGGSTCGYNAMSTTAIADGIAYTTGSGVGSGAFAGLVAHDAKTGKKLWGGRGTSGPIQSQRAPADRAPCICSPSIGNGRVYVGLEDGTFHSLEAKKGALLWSIETDSAVRGSASIATHNDIVIFGNDAGELRAVQGESGKELWSFKAGDSIRSSVWLTKDAIYMTSTDGFLYALTNVSP